MVRLVLPECVTFEESALGEDLQVFEFGITPKRARMVTVFRESTRYYTINDLDVERAYRRQGLGKLLAGLALEHARELKADIVMAGIISRECLDVMTDVFGADSVDVRNSGDYAPPGRDENFDYPTSAALFYDLS